VFIRVTYKEKVAFGKAGRRGGGCLPQLTCGIIPWSTVETIGGELICTVEIQSCGAQFPVTFYSLVLAFTNPDWCWKSACLCNLTAATRIPHMKFHVATFDVDCTAQFLWGLRIILSNFPGGALSPTFSFLSYVSFSSLPRGRDKKRSYLSLSPLIWAQCTRQGKNAPGQFLNPRWWGRQTYFSIQNYGQLRWRGT